MIMLWLCKSVLGEQAYLINIVWSCYKYLLAMCRILPQTQSDVGRGQPPCQSASQPLSPIQSVTATVNATATSPDAQVLSLSMLCYIHTSGNFLGA